MAASSSGAPFATRLLGTWNDDGTVTGVTTGTSQTIKVAPYPNLTVYIIGSAALSAGTVIIEETYNDGISNPSYSQVTSVTLSSPFASAGGQSAVHLGGPGGQYAYYAVRVRIGTTVVGGTVACALIGN